MCRLLPLRRRLPANCIFMRPPKTLRKSASPPRSATPRLQHRLQPLQSFCATVSRPAPTEPYPRPRLRARTSTHKPLIAKKTCSPFALTAKLRFVAGLPGETACPKLSHRVHVRGDGNKTLGVNTTPIPLVRATLVCARKLVSLQVVRVPFPAFVPAPYPGIACPNPALDLGYLNAKRILRQRICARLLEQAARALRFVCGRRHYYDRNRRRVASLFVMMFRRVFVSLSGTKDLPLKPVLKWS